MIFFTFYFIIPSNLKVECTNIVFTLCIFFIWSFASKNNLIFGFEQLFKIVLKI
jgi:hypothetical protein